ncbi:hypothetical protein EGR_10832 [Echinococcus granulosus]|uniref:Uncharacterized protein n=1 Tax=Echinococcus granulosus TaxID=6210 RepID=W6ULB5_ECHGR|nr:hypothetical protein EGR_10832 [Echinococcus granulosus]EUB54309.1 hypothetical protein EGR_10832 [Echinococcus granulosus]
MTSPQTVGACLNPCLQLHELSLSQTSTQYIYICPGFWRALGHLISKIGWLIQSLNIDTPNSTRLLQEPVFKNSFEYSQIIDINWKQKRQILSFLFLADVKHFGIFEEFLNIKILLKGITEVQN